MLLELKLYPVGNTQPLTPSRDRDGTLSRTRPGRLPRQPQPELMASEENGGERRRILIRDRGPTLNQKDGIFVHLLKWAGEALTTQLCPIRGKLERLVLCVRQGTQWVGGQSLERNGSERLITLGGRCCKATASVTWCLQRPDSRDRVGSNTGTMTLIDRKCFLKTSLIRSHKLTEDSSSYYLSPFVILWVYVLLRATGRHLHAKKQLREPFWGSVSRSGTRYGAEHSGTGSEPATFVPLEWPRHRLSCSRLVTGS